MSQASEAPIVTSTPFEIKGALADGEVRAGCSTSTAEEPRRLSRGPFVEKGRAQRRSRGGGSCEQGVQLWRIGTPAEARRQPGMLAGDPALGDLRGDSRGRRTRRSDGLTLGISNRFRKSSESFERLRKTSGFSEKISKKTSKIQCRQWSLSLSVVGRQEVQRGCAIASEVQVGCTLAFREHERCR